MGAETATGGAEALVRARATAGTAEDKVLAWAATQAREHGVDTLAAAFLRRQRWMLVAMVAAATVVGFSGALGVLGDGSRPVNVVWALGGLLGIHFLSLLIWLASFGVGGAGLADGGGGFGRLWQWLASRGGMPDGMTTLVRARMELLARGGVTRWWLGAATHMVWAGLLAGVVAGLLVAFSTRRYGFVWETTLLPAEVFETWVAATGHWPAWLGFAVPDSGMVRASAEAVAPGEAARIAWASWLIGCVVGYGLLPRAVLATGCAALAAWRMRRVGLDLGLSWYVLLGDRISPASERIGVTDAAPGGTPDALARPEHGHGHGRPVLVGVECERVPALFEAVARGGVATELGVIEGREQRHEVLAQLDVLQPRRLLVVCDPRLSPDRGSLHLVAELARRATRTRVALLPVETAPPERLAYWREGLAGLGFDDTQVATDAHAALGWLEYGNAG